LEYLRFLKSWSPLGKRSIGNVAHPRRKPQSAQANSFDFLKHCTLASNVKAADFVSLAVSFFARWSMQQRPPSFGKRGQRGDLTTATAQSAAGSAMVRELCRNFETSH